MAQTINVTCNSVNKRVNNSQVRFDISNGDGGNAGNVTLNINQNGNLGLAGNYEPGKEYKIVIKEAKT